MARPSTAARRYAEAAFEIGLRDGTVDAWRDELDAAATVVSDPDVAAGLHDPSIPTAEREAALAKGMGASVGKPVLNLILLMIRRGRIDQLPRVAEEFHRLDDRRNGITTALATSAAPLGPAEVSALTERLQEMTGGRVRLDLEVDPSLLGGLVVRVGDRLIDGSVRGRLERLRNQLVSGAL
jgi:F-type H+-transporting ATPase subunit delta